MSLKSNFPIPEQVEQTPMSDKVKERIEKDAHNYCKESEVCYWSTVNGYIAGATAERPIAWNEAIDACIIELQAMSKRSFNVDFHFAYKLAIENLEKLKQNTYER